MAPFRFATNSRSVPFIFQKLKQIVANLMFDVMDLNYGMILVKDSRI